MRVDYGEYIGNDGYVYVNYILATDMLKNGHVDDGGYVEESAY